MVSFEPDLSVADQSSFDFDTFHSLLQIFAREHLITANYSLLALGLMFVIRYGDPTVSYIAPGA